MLRGTLCRVEELLTRGEGCKSKIVLRTTYSRKSAFGQKRCGNAIVLLGSAAFITMKKKCFNAFVRGVGTLFPRVLVHRN